MKVRLTALNPFQRLVIFIVGCLLEVKSSLERRRADVIELYQGMSELMTEIHGAIVQCMNATLSELRRSNANVNP